MYELSVESGSKDWSLGTPTFGSQDDQEEPAKENDLEQPEWQEGNQVKEVDGKPSKERILRITEWRWGVCASHQVK